MTRTLSRLRADAGGAAAIRTALYLAAQIVQRVGNLILLSMLVLILTASEFSRYGLLMSSLSLIGVAFSLNLHFSPNRLLFDYTDPEDQADFLKTVLLGSLGLDVMFLGLLLLGIGLLQIDEPISQGDLQIQLWVALSIIALMIVDFSKNVMRAEGRAVLFLLTEILRQIGLVGLFLVLSGLLADGLLAFGIAFTLSALIAGVLALLPSYRRILRGRFRWHMFRNALSYTAPTVVHAIMMWVLWSSGRWIGIRYMTLEALAPYMLITQITLIVNMFSRSLFEARIPEISTAFASGQVREAQRIIQQLVALALPIIALIYGGLYVVVFVLKWELPFDYAPTVPLLAFSLLANVFDALYLRGIQILGGLKRTPVQAVGTFFSGMVTVLISFPLAEQGGDTGLILALTFGLLLQALVSNLLAQAELRRAIQ
jgi:O-antigen/teichoic acid export membrane protein